MGLIGCTSTSHLAEMVFIYNSICVLKPLCPVIAESISIIMQKSLDEQKFKIAGRIYTPPSNPQKGPKV